LSAERADLTLAEGLVLIDGACVLCSASFRFVARRDRDQQFRFALVQGAFGRTLAQAIGIDPDQPDSFAVILNGRPLFKSDGAIAILRRLPGWRWTSVLLKMPRPFRDWVYDRVARNRYRLFGRLDACLVPTAELRAHMHNEMP
jgi:predicted DCC family thiol-disulfide oxidoreductase YuxK